MASDESCGSLPTLQKQRVKDGVDQRAAQNALAKKLQAAVNHTQSYVERVQTIQQEQQDLYIRRVQWSYIQSGQFTCLQGVGTPQEEQQLGDGQTLSKEELKRMTRSLQIFKMRRDALSGGTCIHDRPQTKLQMAHSNTDIATKMFCRSVAEEIVQAALKRFDNRPEIAAVQKEQRQWQVSKLELEQDCAQRLLLVVLANVVQECIRSVVDDIHSDLMLPQAFAVRLLTKSIASTRRASQLPGSQHVIYKQVLRHMQSERRRAQFTSCHFRSTLPLQAVLPPDVPAWAKSCIASAAVGNTGSNGHSRHLAQTIRHGDPPTELHAQASKVEECYWNKAQFVPYGEPAPLEASLGEVTDLAVHPAGFCLAVCTGHGHLKVFDVRCSQLREVYHHSSTPSAPASTGKTKNAQQQRDSSQHVEFCGLAFGYGAHLSVTTSDGSLVPFLLRPNASSSDNPDSVLTPMALLMLRPDAQAETGKSKLNDSVLSVAYSVQQASQLQNLEKHENQVVTLKFRPVYMSSVTLSGAAPNIVFPQRTGDLLSIRLPIAGPILPAQRAVRAALIQQKKDVQILQAANPLPAIPLKVQRLYRHHDALVVYAAPYGPGGAFLSIDLTGRIVLWPPSYDTENALGWTQPMQVFCLAKVMKVPQLGGHHDNRPWLVTYLRLASGTARISVAAPDPLQQNMYEHSLASVVNTATIGSTSNAAGQSRIQVTYSFVQTQVVGAQLSSDRALLVLVTLIRAADGREEEWGAYFRFHVVSCRDWTVTLPVIDVLDISGGGLAAPTFSIRPTVSSLGSEYLFTALGLDAVGIYSLTTAQLLREIQICTLVTGVMLSSIMHLSVFCLTSFFGGVTDDSQSEADNSCKQWKILLAAVLGPPACKVILFQLQEENAEAAALQYRRKMLTLPSVRAVPMASNQSPRA